MLVHFSMLIILQLISLLTMCVCRKIKIMNKTHADQIGGASAILPSEQNAISFTVMSGKSPTPNNHWEHLENSMLTDQIIALSVKSYLTSVLV